MGKTKKIVVNTKPLEGSIRSSLVVIGICLLVFLLVGCTDSTQRPAEKFTASGEATMTIIEHDFSGDYAGDSSTSDEKTPGGNEFKTPDTFIENRIENIPYYFIEVYNGQEFESESKIKTEESFNYLEEMISAADAGNIKLTLGFSKQREEYIAENPARLAMLYEWEKSGHQIVYDSEFGLSGFSESEDAEYEERLVETGPEKGINEFILSGMVNGSESKWLTLYRVTNKEFLNQAIRTFEKLDSSVVYGIAAQSVKEQTPIFYAYLDYLHSIDPEGLNSKTLKSIIEKKLIPEKIIPEEALERQYQ